MIGLLASVAGPFAGLGLAKLLTASAATSPRSGWSPRCEGPGLARARHRHHAAGRRHACAARHSGCRRSRPSGRARPAGLTLRGALAKDGRRRDRGVRHPILVGIFVSGLGTMASPRCSASASGAVPRHRARPPHAVKPLTRLVGLPARRAAIAGDLASANSRQPHPHRPTAAALMIGLTLVTRRRPGRPDCAAPSICRDRPSQAPYLLNGTYGVQFEAAEGDALARAPGVKTASHVRIDKTRVGADEPDVTGVHPSPSRAPTISTGPRDPRRRSASSKAAAHS